VSAGEHARDRDQAAELLAVAVETARAAGSLLLERFEQGAAQDIRSKSTPTDLVSEADLASQRAIRHMLADMRPQDGFLGEEEGEEERVQREPKGPGRAHAHDDRRAGRSGGLRWIVDPLDGTVNFLFGIPQWCVSVAVQEGEETLAGAIFDPSRAEMWTATRDDEARLNGKPTRRSRRPELSTAMVATGLFYDARVRAAQGRVLAKLVPRVRDLRRCGSAALDLAWTAAGRYDAYFERGVKLWDVAAGALICARAGLEVVDLAPSRGRGGLPTGLLAAPSALVGPLLELVG
jgi:myo-inositol-1(or 4)-monophosphatase